MLWNTVLKVQINFMLPSAGGDADDDETMVNVEVGDEDTAPIDIDVE